MTSNKSGSGNGGSRAIGDITGSKPAERDDRGLEEEWRSLVENIPDIVMTLDRDGTILFINRTPPGFTVEATIGAIVYDFVPVEHHDTLRRSLKGVFEAGDAHDYEIAAPGPFGRTSWYFSRIGPVVRDGKVVAAAVIATDVTERKRAEEALRESEERYRDLVDTARDVIYTVSADATLLSLNPAFEAITGWSRAEWLGKPFADIVHPDDLSLGVENFRCILRGEVPPPSEIRILTKSGEYLTGEFAARPLIADGQVVGSFGIVRDITGRKRAEEALRESEERFRSAFEDAAVGMALVALDGRILEVNQICSQMLGYSKRELTSMTWQDVSHPDDLDTVRDRIERIVGGEIDSYQLEKRYVHKDGHVLWGHLTSSLIRGSDGTPLYFISQIQDITERKRAEEALRKSEERYRDLAENLNDAIFEFDASGRMTHVSPGMEKVSGYSAPEMIGRLITDFVYPEDLPAMTDRVRRRPFGDREPSEYRFLRKSGEARWVRSLGWPMFEGHRVVGFRAVLTDITERRRAEDALRQSEEQFRHLVEEVSDLIYEVDAAGRVTYVSPAVEQILGYRPSEMIGRSLTDFLRPDDVSGVVKSFQEALTKIPGPAEYGVMAKSGEIRWLRNLARPILEGDRVVGFRGVQTDITDRKRAEEALRQSEERYRHLVENINQVIYEVDADGRISYISPVVTQLGGYSPSEMVGRPFTDFLHPDDVVRAVGGLGGSLSGEHEPADFRFFSKSGELHWMRTFGQPILDGDRVVGLRGVLTNVTDRKEIEQALRESEERHRRLVENINDAIYELGADGRVTYISPVVEEISGYTQSEVVGRLFADFVHPDDLSALVDRFRRGLDGQPEPIEFRIPFKSGEIHWFRSMGQPIVEGDRIVGFRGVVSDITERKQVEDALRESEAKFRALAESASAAVFLSDGETFSYVNPAAETISGYAQEELLSMGFLDIVHPEFREVNRGNVRAQLGGEAVPSPFELKIVTKDGHERWLLATSTAVPFGGDVMLLGTAIDITERKRAEGAVSRQAEVNSSIAEVSRALIESRPIDDISDVVLECAKRLTSSPFGFVAYIDPQTGYLVAPTLTKDIWDTCQVPDKDIIFKEFRGLWGWVLVNRKPLLTNASADDPRSSGTPPGHVPVHRFLSVPALIGATLLGQVAVANSDRDYIDDDLLPLKRLAVLYALAIQRKRAEEALRESEERWRSLAENVPDIIMTVDADGKILFINRTVPGLAVESVIGTNLSDYVPPEHHDTQRRALERVFETGEPQSYEIAGAGPHGGTSWYFSRIGPVARGDKVVAAILITTDVTEERRAEEALRASEDRYRTLVEAAPDVIYTLSTDGTITSLNSAFEALSGWPREDWLGKHFAPIIHPDDLPAAMEDFRLVLQGEVPPVREYRMLTESGQYIAAETVPRPLIVDGEVVGTLGIARDLTSRRQMEDTLQKVREELEAKVERQMRRQNPYGLSFREFLVLHLVTAGQSDREIGATLGISPVTAQKHVENLRAKMKAASRMEAGVRALREGLLD